MRDLVHQIAPRSITGPGAPLTASPGAVTLDRSGFDSVTFVMDVGVGTTAFSATNRLDFNVQESDDNVTFTNVADAGLLGVSGTTNGNIFSVIAVPAAEAITKIGYVGNKRYLKCQPVLGGTHAGTAINWQAILSQAWTNPTS